MYFSALKRLIASVEEKLFYDVALMFLTAQGYRDVSIVDGTGDGGRDVISSRADLRIQLSVRKDWENKINDEAGLALNAGKRHLIYVTNRLITPDAEAEFKTHRYKYAGQVEVSIYDLNYISTTLARAGIINQAYAALGISVDQALSPTPREVAISTVLLFGREAQELRDSVVEANICATLLDRDADTTEPDLIAQVASTLPGVNMERAIRRGISHLRVSGAIVGSATSPKLSSEKEVQLTTARADFTQALDQDVEAIKRVSGLNKTDSKLLLAKARQLLVRGRDFQGGGPLEEDVHAFLAQKRLLNKRNAIYECLSAASTIRQFQFGETIDRILSTDTFDIYRALGGKTDLVMVLDTSVALPLLLGLEFPARESRYGLAVSDLDHVCKQHGIKMLVPGVYVNEMAAHGRKALDFIELYPALPEEAHYALRNSRNAYLSHYSHIPAIERKAISLADFLAHFGLENERSLRRIENRLTSMLESHGINTGFSSWYEQGVRDEIERLKPDEKIRVIIDHDAAVCTDLLKHSKEGYIFATWDNVLIDVVQDLARVFADNPARINDTLSVIDGVTYETEHSHELLFTLLHMEEEAGRKLAEKIEAIESVEQAYRFKAFVQEARGRRGSDWRLDETHLLQFFSIEQKSAATGGQSIGTNRK